MWLVYLEIRTLKHSLDQCFPTWGAIRNWTFTEIDPVYLSSGSALFNIFIDLLLGWDIALKKWGNTALD